MYAEENITMKWLKAIRKTQKNKVTGRGPKKILDAIRRTPKDQLDEIALINDALMEWRAAVDYFQQVTDPMMIDHAIFRINAAKCRYEYLVRCRKNAAGETGQA